MFHKLFVQKLKDIKNKYKYLFQRLKFRFLGKWLFKLLNLTIYS